MLLSFKPYLRTATLGANEHLGRGTQLKPIRQPPEQIPAFLVAKIPGMLAPKATHMKSQALSS